jgi:uncharacterized cupin superfamily protein
VALLGAAVSVTPVRADKTNISITLESNYPTALDDPQDIVYKQLLDNAPVTISVDDGTVLAFAEQSLSFDLQGHDFAGEGSLNMRGAYDAATGAVTGAYAMDYHFRNDMLGLAGWETDSYHYSGALTGTVKQTDKTVALYGPGSSTHRIIYEKNDKSPFTDFEEAAPSFPYKVSIHDATVYMEWDPEYWKGRVDSGARFSDLAGQVEINMPNMDGTFDEEAWMSAKLNQVLPAGTHIRTVEGTKSEAIISFADASTFHLKPESEIILDFASDRSGCTLKGTLKILAGNMWANIKKMAKDGCMQVEMSQGVSGIKGTTFIVSDDMKSSTLQVIEGQVTMTASNGKAVSVGAGEQVTATDKGLSTKTAFDAVSASGYGVIDHSAVGSSATAGSSAAAGASQPADASQPAATDPWGSSGSSGSSLPLVLGAAGAVLIVVAVGVVVASRRRRPPVRG